MLPNRDRSGDPVTRGAEVDCVRVFSATMDAARWQGATLGRRPERRSWAGQSTPNRPQPASKDRFKRFGRCVPPRFCRVRGAVGEEKGRLKSLSSKAYPQTRGEFEGARSSCLTSWGGAKAVRAAKKKVRGVMALQTGPVRSLCRTHRKGRGHEVPSTFARTCSPTDLTRHGCGAGTSSGCGGPTDAIASLSRA